MNLRELSIFVAVHMANRLTECGIDVDQIEQIKIYNRQIPSNDNNLVWELKASNHSFLCIVSKIERWIKTQIIICYMNENLDGVDLSIEIMGNGKGMMAI